MLSGFTRMPPPSTVIIIEATASLDVLAPIILSCVVARATAAALVGRFLDERLIAPRAFPPRARPAPVHCRRPHR